MCLLCLYDSASSIYLCCMCARSASIASFVAALVCRITWASARAFQLVFGDVVEAACVRVCGAGAGSGGVACVSWFSMRSWLLVQNH